jgi:two-component system, chemotaxis family, chemotaxis protein CheY
VPRILVVDDDVTIRDSIKLVLETAGIEIMTAESGERALEAFSGAAFDGAIIDLMMPGMSGLETVCALREKSPDLPIVIVSGSLTRGVAMPELLRMATELKGVTSLAKPFKLSELLQTVRERFAAVPELASKPAA